MFSPTYLIMVQWIGIFLLVLVGCSHQERMPSSVGVVGGSSPTVKAFEELDTSLRKLKSYQGKTEIGEQ